MSVVNSPIHDLLVRIKNAYMARKLEVKWVIYSKFKENILNLLKRNSFIEDFEIVNEDKKSFINIYLYEVKDPINDILNIKFYSKPSRRWYVWSDMISKVAWGKWIAILSTNKWVLSNTEAISENIWWELIAEIY